jgi:predicted metalloprotease with PDZ domain
MPNPVARHKGRARSRLADLQEPIVYHLRMPDPQSHEYLVELRVPALTDHPVVELAFPAWAPGSYMIRDFVRHVYRLEITDPAGNPLPQVRVDKQRWSVDAEGQPFVVRYRVFAFETTVRTAFLDDGHAYFNGTSLFFQVMGEVTRPYRLEIVPPTGWHVSTALPAAPAAPAPTPIRGRPGRRARRAGAAPSAFLARDFDDLVDAPVEIGTHPVHAFRAGGCRFELALYGRTNASVARLLRILRQVVLATSQIFGGDFPFDRYLFIVHALPVASGGLEHRASVTMDIAGLSFDDEQGYVRFADLAAHEFFHVWNVKRLHDPALGPAFDYGRESYTRLLWFHEGFTDYLANVIILRAGVIDDQAFWRWICADWPRYANRPGRLETPLSELSFEAWIKQYKPSENHFNRAVSYYEKGLWVGMALDLELRIATRGRRGLPELFGHLWNEAGRQDAPLTEADIRTAAEAIGGRSFDAFFERYVHGRADVPLPRLWRRAGLEVHLRRTWDKDRQIGGDPRLRARARSWIGVALNSQPTPAATSAGAGERALVKNVLPESPAALAGLTFGDEIVAVDGDRVTAATLARRVGDHPPGSRITVTYFRRDQLRTTEVVVGTSPERTLELIPAKAPTATAAAITRGWLGI